MPPHRPAQKSPICECAALFPGTHDFAGFQASRGDQKGTVRTAAWSEQSWSQQPVRPPTAPEWATAH